MANGDCSVNKAIRCYFNQMTKKTNKSYGTMRHVRSGKNTHYRRNLSSLWHRKYGRQGSKKAYTGGEDRYIPADQIWLWSINRGRLYRSRNDRQTSRQTYKQNGMTIRLTLCERDAIMHSTLNFTQTTTTSDIFTLLGLYDSEQNQKYKCLPTWPERRRRS